MNCAVCGRAMNRFKNEDGTDRFVCFNAVGHRALEHAARERGAKSGQVRADIRKRKGKGA